MKEDGQTESAGLSGRLGGTLIGRSGCVVGPRWQWVVGAAAAWEAGSGRRRRIAKLKILQCLYYNFTTTKIWLASGKGILTQEIS